MIMAYTGGGSLAELELTGLQQLLTVNGWTPMTAICVILFSLMHFPCATTCWTICKETKSVKWTAVAFLLPTVIGLICCLAVKLIFGIFA
jgi:ferrous iron transport protein B